MSFSFLRIIRSLISASENFSGDHSQRVWIKPQRTVRAIGVPPAVSLPFQPLFYSPQPSDGAGVFRSLMTDLPPIEHIQGVWNGESRGCPFEIFGREDGAKRLGKWSLNCGLGKWGMSLALLLSTTAPKAKWRPSEDGVGK
jgi:hypothetical protein